MLGLPTAATAPFCPPEVRGSVEIPCHAPLWQRLLKVAGPGLLVAVGYIDPGSRFGPALLWVVLATSLSAMLLQAPALRLGIATGLQIVLSMQLPFAIWPLLRMNGDRRLMGTLLATMAMRIGGWLLLALICLANAALLRGLLAG